MLASGLFLEYVDLRLEQVTGEEKLQRHECCRKQVVNELLDLKALVIEQNAIEQSTEATPEPTPI